MCPLLDGVAGTFVHWPPNKKRPYTLSTILDPTEHVSVTYGARLYTLRSTPLHPTEHASLYLRSMPLYTYGAGLYTLRSTSPHVGADPIATLLRRGWGRSSARIGGFAPCVVPSSWATGVFRAATGLAAAPPLDLWSLLRAKGESGERGANPPFATEGEGFFLRFASKASQRAERGVVEKNNDIIWRKPEAHLGSLGLLLVCPLGLDSLLPFHEFL